MKPHTDNCPIICFRLSHWDWFDKFLDIMLIGFPILTIYLIWGLI